MHQERMPGFEELPAEGEFYAMVSAVQARPLTGLSGTPEASHNAACELRITFRALLPIPEPFLEWSEYWPAPDSAHDGMVKMLRDAGVPAIGLEEGYVTSALVGRWFRLRSSVGIGDEGAFRRVDIVGFVERPLLER
jgi:hypothetical protein